MLQTLGILNYNKNTHMGNPCGKYTTDSEFLKHMIPHHQVAIDMSKRVLIYTVDPNIIYLAREIIFTQPDEILFMENILLSGIPHISSNDKHRVEIIPNQFSIWYNHESRADNYQCGLHHFSTTEAIKHEKHLNLDSDIFSDKSFLEHMI